MDLSFIVTIFASAGIAAFGAIFTYVRKTSEDPGKTFRKASFWATTAVGAAVGVIAAFNGIEITFSPETFAYVAAQLLLFQKVIEYSEGIIRIMFTWFGKRYPGLPALE